jgi:hypothetical protein
MDNRGFRKCKLAIRKADVESFDGGISISYSKLAVVANSNKREK